MRDPLILTIIVLFILWALGWGFAIGGGLIHILIVIALVLVIYKLATGKQVL